MLNKANETMQENPSPGAFEQLNNWFTRSITVKLIIIVFLALILLIPASMVQGIINERESKQSYAAESISNEWASEQNVAGPVLTVPVAVINPDGSKQWTNYVHLLPDDLVIDGNVAPQSLHRGIYDAVVYTTALDIKATFDLSKLNSEIQDIKGTPDWQKAYFAVGISDLRGVKDNILVAVNNNSITAKAGVAKESPIHHGVSVPFKDVKIDSNGKFTVQYKLALQGSQMLEFQPLGNTTNIEIRSKWTNPSFTGAFLPDERVINDQGFAANWRVLELNRNFPQTWKNDEYNIGLDESAFGITLMTGPDDYQKSMRSVKYAILTIGLTFLLFFLFEIMNKRRMHPFQYILVGLALCLFYILLISLSEQMAFNLAYIISSMTIILMITLYSRTVFPKWRSSGILAIILIALYTYLFVTIQISDYALLLGSLGLTLMLAVTMYATRKIKWYGNE